MNIIKLYKSLYILMLVCLLKAEGVQPIIKIGYDFGVGDLILAEKNNNNGLISTINGGDGLHINVGLLVPIIKDFELQTLIGYKQASLNNNKNNKFTNIQITSLLMTTGNRWKIGVGGSYHIQPKLITTTEDYEVIQFQNVFAGILQFEYVLNHQLSVGIQGTIVDYTRLDNNRKNILTDGNSIGIFVTFTPSL